MNNPSPELLIDLYFDGTLTEEQGELLLAWLKQSPKNVEHFVDCATVHAALRKQHVVRNIGQTRRDVLGSAAGLSADDVLNEARVHEKLAEIELPELPAMPRTPHAQSTPDQEPHARGQIETKTVLKLPGLRVYRSSTGGEGATRPVWRSPLFAVAALLLIGLTLLVLWPHTPQPPAKIATLTNQHNVIWNEQAAPLTPGHRFIAGRYSIDRGFAEIQLARGTTLVFEGPCEFDLLDDNSIFLHAGRVSADVPESARLFAINTPSLLMIDYGTEFGVDFNRRTGQATAAVFKGVVEVAPTRDDETEPRKLVLRAMQQVSADHTGQLPESPDTLAHSHPFIRSIEESRDRVELQGQVEFYRIAPASVHDRQLITPENAVLFRERKGVVLKDALDELLTESGEYRFISIEGPFTGTVPAGATVDSYLLHYDNGNQGEVRRCELTLRFPRKVLGILSVKHHLNDTDRTLGHPDTIYPTMGEPVYKNNPMRGVDWLDHDYIKISEDRLTVTFHLSAERMDQARILIQSE